MTSRRQVLLITGALAVALALVVAAPALADTSQIGKNVGKEIKTWGSALLLGVAALVGLPALAKRDLSQGMLIVVLVLVIGGFIWATGPVQDVIKSLWHAFV